MCVFFLLCILEKNTYVYILNKQNRARNTQQAQPPSGSFVSFGESLRTTSCTGSGKKEK